MATTLPPEILALLRGSGSNGVMDLETAAARAGMSVPDFLAQGGSGADMGGYDYTPMYSSYSGGGPESGETPGGRGPITGWDRTRRLSGNNGGDGDFTGDTFDLEGNLTDSRSWNQNAAKEIASGIASMVAGYYGMDSLFGPGGLATTGGGAAGGGALGGEYAGFSPLDVGGGPDWASLLADGGGAGIGSAADIGGSGADVGQRALTSAERAAMNSGSGYGTGMSGAQTGLFDTINGLTGNTTLASLGAGTAGGGGGLLNSLGNAAGSVVSGIANNPGLALAGLLGAAGGSQATGGGASSNVRTLDPRIDPLIFGQGGLLSSVQDFMRQNPTGMNDAMRASSANMRQQLTSPGFLGGLGNQHAAAQRLLSMGVAPNPFGG